MPSFTQAVFLLNVIKDHDKLHGFQRLCGIAKLSFRAFLCYEDCKSESPKSGIFSQERVDLRAFFHTWVMGGRVLTPDPLSKLVPYGNELTMFCCFFTCLTMSLLAKMIECKRITS